ncbi:MAG TPA: CHAT domain-containing protein [Pirellulaceae bacterium]|nr:CHAT domain-containing protein [Pirellulaceae bacterium]
MRPVDVSPFGRLASSVSAHRGRGLIVAAVLLGLGLLPSSAAAQLTGSNTYPNEFYAAGFAPYYDGDFRDAARQFRRAGQSGYVGVNGRWIDSICYYTMLGECLYRVGDLADALAQYDTALQIVVADPQWWSRVEFPAGIQASNSQAPARITWGSSTRSTALGSYPNSFSVMTGRLDALQAFQRGGVVDRAQFRQFDIVEIARCTALAIRRRNEILGPIAIHDPFNAQLVRALGQSGLPANHWATPFVSVPLAMALQGTGESDKAAELLASSLQIGGRFDHPLTGMALIEIGRIKTSQEKWNEAQAAFLEATYSGAAFELPDVVEEGFRGATIVHLIRRAPGVFAPLDPAATWARTRGSRPLQVALPTLAAECALNAGDTRAAGTLLDQAVGQIGRSDLGASMWAGRIAYQRAHLAFRSGNVVAGNAALADAMKYQRSSGLWLFRINLVDTFRRADGISEKVADDLYTDLLRDPTERDWRTDPMETLSVVLTPHPGPYERWFDIVVARREIDRAIDIGDRMKRHRFYSTLPLGGRDLNFRWLVAAPDDALDRESLQFRQKLLLDYSVLVDLTRRITGLEKELDALPVRPADGSPELREQKRILDELAVASTALEAALGDLALRREPSPTVFPPALPLDKVQELLGERQIVWNFIETSSGAYAAFVTKSDYAIQPLPAAAKVRTLTAKAFREMGLVDRNAAISAETLTGEGWREPLAELRELLLGERKKDFWLAFDELVIVPDGPLWYLPFEALPVEAESTEPLVDTIAIRYAPTLGTAIPFRRDASSPRPIGVLLGKVHPKDPPEAAVASFDKLHETFGDAQSFDGALPGPSSLVGALCSRWLVLDDLADRSNSPYGWSPLPAGRGRNASGTLDSWLPLPWRSADTLLLPGFRSAADSGLKNNADGNELFLACCGLMASGTRTAILARWRMGGDATQDLMVEFLATGNRGSAARRWRETVSEFRSSPLDPALETRLDVGRDPFPADRSHPLFWSGYLLMDDGRPGDAPEGEGVPDPGLPGLKLPDAPGEPLPDDAGGGAAPGGEGPGAPGGAGSAPAIPGGGAPGNGGVPNEPQNGGGNGATGRSPR